MSDVDMGATETSATGVALVAAMVQAQLIAKAQLMFAVQDESSRATKGAKSVAFPRTGDLSPVAKVENVGTDSQALTYAVDTLTLNQHMHTLVRLEDFGEIQSVVNIEADIIERAGAGMAKTMDTYIYDALVAGASASAPDHIVADYAASAAISRTKILTNRKLLDNQNVPAEDRFMLISPKQEAQILDIDQFVSAEKYGDRTPLLNGEIGRLFGFRILKSTICADDVTLYFHKSAAAFARQLEPKWESFRDVKNLCWTYSLSSLYGAKVLDSGKRVVVANATGS